MLSPGFPAPVSWPDCYPQRSCWAEILPFFAFYFLSPLLTVWSCSSPNFYKGPGCKQALPGYDIQEPAEALPINVGSFCTSSIGTICCPAHMALFLLSWRGDRALETREQRGANSWQKKKKKRVFKWVDVCIENSPDPGMFPHVNWLAPKGLWKLPGAQGLREFWHIWLRMNLQVVSCAVPSARK